MTIEGKGYTEQEFADKVAWEGGVIDAVDYGLSYNDLADKTTPLAVAWREVESAWQKIRPLEDRVNEILGYEYPYE